jgi:hypothetical protein
VKLMSTTTATVASCKWCFAANSKKANNYKKLPMDQPSGVFLWLIFLLALSGQRHRLTIKLKPSVSDLPNVTRGMSQYYTFMFLGSRENELSHSTICQKVKTELDS